MITPHHTERIRVTYAQTDMGGAAHAANALLWADQAEQSLLRMVGLPPTFPRRRVEIDYLGPVAYDAEVDVDIAVVAVGKTSLTYAWEGRVGDRVVFTGRTVVVNVIDNVATSVPQPLRDLLADGAQ